MDFSKIISAPSSKSIINNALPLTANAISKRLSKQFSVSRYLEKIIKIYV